MDHRESVELPNHATDRSPKTLVAGGLKPAGGVKCVRNLALTPAGICQTAGGIVPWIGSDPKPKRVASEQRELIRVRREIVVHYQ